MSLFNTILKASWNAVFPSGNPTILDTKKQGASILPISFIKESPGSLNQNVPVVWLRNVNGLAERGIPEEGIPCRVGLFGGERAVLKPNVIYYPDRLYIQDQNRRWEPR